MCGIIGYYNILGEKISSTAAIQNAVSAQKHRGPDDSGIRAFSFSSQQSEECTTKVAQTLNNSFEGIIGFNRLSILDLSMNGHQPMVNEEENIILCLNGEIYNAFSYRKQLQNEGYHFKSNTDTEVVLALYIKYGFHEMITRLNGMFAIVIIDLKKGSIYISKDRFGIKPMYYYQDKKVFAYSSELKSFYSLPGFSASINTSLLDEYFLFRNNVNDTLINNISGIEPGHYLVYNFDTGLSSREFYDVNVHQRVIEKKPFEYYAQNFREDLFKSVKSQLISDVKLGCQLSGGVDSSLITWATKNIKQNIPVDTVSIVFDSLSFNEEKYVNHVVKQLQVQSHKFTLTGDDYIDMFESATWHLESPMNHPNTIGIYLLAQKAKKYVTVLLSGEGADEVYGGYSRFFDQEFPYFNRRFFFGIKNNRTKPLSFLKYHANSTYRNILSSSFNTPSLAKSLMPGFNFEKATAKRKDIYDSLTGSGFDKQVKYEMKTYLPDLLLRQDKMSMAHSVENRVPFLDNDMVANSFNIPQDYLLKIKYLKGTVTTKYLLKQQCAEVFGHDFAYRHKMGFGIPIKQFLNTKKGKEYLYYKVLPSIKKSGIFDAKIAENLIVNLDTISLFQLDALWIIISFEIWMSKFIYRA